MDTLKVIMDTTSVKVQTVSAITTCQKFDWNNLSCSDVAACVVGILILCTVVVFGILLCVYYIRKDKYYHDLTHKKNPTHIRYQMSMVFCALFGFVLLCSFLALITPPDWFKWFAVVGVLLTWVCQDIVKNIVSYVVLVCNGMLHLKDWIVLEKYGIDGEVSDISITSVIVKNWDETLSSISTRTLLDTNMQNLQNMSEQKTPGRRMQRNFLIDVHSVHNLTEEQLLKLKKHITGLDGDDSAIDYAIVKGEHQNLRIFRLYLRHWMLNQDTVSRSPKIAIRLFDQTSEGLPMQVYAFLLPTKWEEFEQEQARIVEHIIGTLSLFGLVLYQSPAGTDTNNVYLTKGGII